MLQQTNQMQHAHVAIWKHRCIAKQAKVYEEVLDQLNLYFIPCSDNHKLEDWKQIVQRDKLLFPLPERTHFLKIHATNTEITIHSVWSNRRLKERLSL